MSPLHRDPTIRASDADRDALAEQLREHAATGRLTMDEFGERLEQVYAAQTYGDLDPLVQDLPGPDPYADLPVSPHGAVPPRSAAAAARSSAPYEHGAHAPVAAAWGAWASTSFICWAIWLATGLSGAGLAGVWPVWVTVPWGGVLVTQAIRAGGQRPALPPGGYGPPALGPLKPGDQHSRRQSGAEPWVRHRRR